jgi:CheY-like chemotaxis protein
VVADDVPVMRLLLRTALEPDFVVVAEAGDGALAAELCGRHTPDVVLLDLNMHHDGLQAIREIRRLTPGTTIVVLSGRPGDLTTSTALSLGADRLVDKAAPLHELRDTLMAAAGR